MIGNLHVVESE